MEKVSLKVARSDNLPYYFTGNACKRGHISLRRTKNRNCVECEKTHKETFKTKNPNYRRDYYDKNREIELYHMRNYYYDNLQHELERRRAYSKEYHKKNKHKTYQNNAKRRSRMLDRTLDIIDQDINNVYEEARKIRDAGREVEVDHIIPLQGEDVSGLHVSWNLQIIPTEANRSKGNKFAPYWENHLTGEVIYCG